MKQVWASDNKRARGGWTRNDAARRPSAGYGTLRPGSAMLKRRLKKLSAALTLVIIYLVFRRQSGWLGIGGDFLSGGRPSHTEARPDARSWLTEKWFTSFHNNATVQRAHDTHDRQREESEVDWYSDREGSSDLVHGLLQHPGERANSAAINVEHLQNWLRFTASHESYDGDDRISFAHMAFQTATYARILRHIDEVPDTLLQEFEEKLWYFIPGLEQMRVTQGHIAGEQRESQLGDAARPPSADDAKPEGHGGLPSFADRLNARLRRRNVAGEDATESDPRSAHVKRAAALDAPTALDRGIVTVAGDDQMQFVVQLLATIRDAHHCDIPIEVYYHDEDDLSEVNRAYLEATFAGVRTVSLADLQLFDDDFSSLAQSSYSMRSFALLATNFTEAMLVDADTVFTIDPHDFFTERGYSKMGTLFFRDLVVHDMKNLDTKKFVTEQLGRRKPSKQLTRTAFWRHELAHLQDSGVVVVNKANANVFAALVFAAWQNSAWLREQITYQNFFGDKETYWLAFELAGLPYHFSAYESGAIGAERSIWTGGFCAEHQLHLVNTQVTHTHTAHIGADHVEDEDHAVSTSEKHELQKGRVAWWNGSLMKSRQRGTKFGDLDAHSTVWAVDGRWKWQGERMCLVDYTRRNARQLAIKPSLEVLLEVGKTALRHMTG